MRQSYLINLTLLLLVLLAFWLLQRPEAPLESQNPLTELSPQSIQNIRIQRSGHPQITLIKSNQHWQLLAPFRARANEARINLLLGLLSERVHSQFATHDNELLNQFGLTETSTVLSLDDQQFVFGGTESLSGRRYLLHNNTISLIDDQVSPLLNASAASFVDNRLLDNTKTISKLRLPLAFDANNQAFVTLSLINGQWQSDSDITLSSDQIVSLIDAWQHAYAMQVTHSNSSTELRQGQTISIWLADAAEPMELFLTHDDKMFTICNPVTHLQYHFPISTLATLSVPTTQAKD
jgi:hypothetical protein